MAPRSSILAEKSILGEWWATVYKGCKELDSTMSD